MPNFQYRHGLSLSEGTVQCAKGPVIRSSWGCLYMLRVFGEWSKLSNGRFGLMIDDSCKVGVGVGAELHSWYWK